MVIENRYYAWVEPKLIVQKGEDKTSYLLYNKISNFKIKDNNFKMIQINVSNDKSEFTTYKADYRIEYVKYLKNLYPESYSNDNGFSAMIDAIKLINDNLIMIYKNFNLMGAVSYDIIDKKKTIDISHIGVIEKRKGYGSILMSEIFSLSKILNYKVEATSNGYADPFYHFCGMMRIVDKPLGIYRIESDYIKDLEKLSNMLNKEKS